MASARARDVQPGAGVAKRSAAIYDGIFGLIVSGEFTENSRLPSETELTRRSASRPVVREAPRACATTASSSRGKARGPM